MTRLEFGLAERDDDAALRRLLRETPMPGHVRLALLREPSFFRAARAGSLDTQVMVCRDVETGRVVGLGERSVRAAYVDGERRLVGYLSNLRGEPDFRKGLALARGYRFLRELHGDGRVPFYVTTILEENTEAIAVLTSGRGGLPRYEEVGRLVTYLLPLRRHRRGRRRGAPPDGAGPVRADELADAWAFLDGWNRRHQLAPAYTVGDLAGRTGLLPDFSVEGLYAARAGGRVVGTLGVWDQSGFRQTVVAKYSPRLGRARPLYNAWAAARGVPGLPPPGRQLRLLHGALFSADTAKTAEALVDRVRHDVSGGDASYLVLGVAERHPLSGALESRAARRLLSRVYAVHWPGEAAPGFDRLRPLHLEIATL